MPIIIHKNKIDSIESDDVPQIISAPTKKQERAKNEMVNALDWLKSSHVDDGKDDYSSVAISTAFFEQFDLGMEIPAFNVNNNRN